MLLLMYVMKHWILWIISQTRHTGSCCRWFPSTMNSSNWLQFSREAGNERSLLYLKKNSSNKTNIRNEENRSLSKILQSSPYLIPNRTRFFNFPIVSGNSLRSLCCRSSCVKLMHSPSSGKESNSQMGTSCNFAREALAIPTVAVI